MTIDPVLLQQVINGLILGAMYALLALGFTLVYGILELINFAHFNVFMVSSFIGMWALELLGLLKGKIVQAGVIDVASDIVETAEDVVSTIRPMIASAIDGLLLSHVSRPGRTIPSTMAASSGLLSRSLVCP